MRRLGTGGQLFLIGDDDRGPDRLRRQVAGRQPRRPRRKIDTYSLRIRTRENIGFGIDAGHVRPTDGRRCPTTSSPRTSTATPSSHAGLLRLTGVDACFTHDLDEEDVPPTARPSLRAGRRPGADLRSTWSIILDITDPKHTVGVRARRKTGRQTTTSVAALVIKGHRAYNARSHGRATPPSTPPASAARSSGTSGGSIPCAKSSSAAQADQGKLLLNLKKAIEKGRLTFPRSGKWLVLRRQLLGYKLDDRKSSRTRSWRWPWRGVRRPPAGGGEQDRVVRLFQCGHPASILRREVRIPLTR